MKALGKIDYVELRQIWSDEARDFTPWLATTEGLSLLGEAINEELELIQIEARVGPFNADVLCQVVGEEGHLVVIENQFGKTDHDHLGKLITYASGLKARTLVWIADVFTDEHRQAIDWLNETKGENVRFFALQIFAIKIGDSLPAPQLKVVSSPNVWAQSVRETTDTELSVTKLDQQKFWEETRDYFKLKKSTLSLREPRPQHWYDIAIGRSNFNIALTINTQLERVGCELYLRGSQAKQAFDLLAQNKEQFEKELGYNLEWQRLDTKEACRIKIYKEGSIYNSVQRQELKEWLYVSVEQFHKVFSPAVKALKLSQEEES